MTHRNSDDLKHLLGDDSPLRKAVTIDVEHGYFHTDTLEETHSLGHQQIFGLRREQLTDP